MMMQSRRNISPVVKGLLIANVAVYVLQVLPGIGQFVTPGGALIPSYVFLKGHVWRLVTYMFLHSPVGIWHILFNMLALWMFGVELERRFGSRRFLVFYAVCGVGSALFSVIMWNAVIIGASGAVLGVLTAYAYFFPNRQVLMFFIFPMPVRFAVAFIGFVSLLGAINSAGGIAHLTHLGGIVIALLFIRFSPPVERLYAHIATLREEKKRRQRVNKWLIEEKYKERYFNEVIDPILKKISSEGMEALTRREKSILQKAAGKYRERIKKSDVVPFNIFKT
jgi:membrane associated rhomboid family serine protease